MEFGNPPLIIKLLILFLQHSPPNIKISTLSQTNKQYKYGKAFSKSLLGDSYEDNIYKDDQNQLILSNVQRCWLAMPLGDGMPYNRERENRKSRFLSGQKYVSLNIFW